MYKPAYDSSGTILQTNMLFFVRFDESDSVCMEKNGHLIKRPIYHSLENNLNCVFVSYHGLIEITIRYFCILLKLFSVFEGEKSTIELNIYLNLLPVLCTSCYECGMLKCQY